MKLKEVQMKDNSFVYLFSLGYMDNLRGHKCILHSKVLGQ